MRWIRRIKNVGNLPPRLPGLGSQILGFRLTRARPKTHDHSALRYTKDSGTLSTQMRHKHQHPFCMLDAKGHSTNAFLLVPNRSSCCFHAQCPRCVRKRCTRAHLCARGCLGLRLRCDGERCWHISTRGQENEKCATPPYAAIMSAANNAGNRGGDRQTQLK